MTSDLEGFSIPDFIHYIYFPILILEKEPIFPFLMLSAKQGYYWYHFYNVLDWGLNPGPPALEASTLYHKAIDEAVFIDDETLMLVCPVLLNRITIYECQ